MIKKILDILSRQNKVCIIHKNLNNGHYRLVVLKKSKGEIDILTTEEGISTFEELVKLIPKNLPVVLGMFGKGILSKKVKYSANYKSSLLLNANEDEFYFFDKVVGENVFASILRKDIIDEEVTLLKSKNIFVTSFYFGPFIFYTDEFIINKDSIYSLDGYQYEFNKSTLSSIEKTKENSSKTFKLGNFEVSQNLLCPVYGGIDYFVNQTDENQRENLPVEEHKHKVLFNRVGLFVLIFFLSSLFGNYIYLNHLNSIIAEKNSLLSENEESLSKLGILKEEKKRKLKLLNNSGILNNSYISFYLDEIAASVPGSILLKELNIYPIKNAIKARKQININDKSILISGYTDNSSPFNEWIQELTESDWISKIEILNYEKKKKKNYEFEIQLQLK